HMQKRESAMSAPDGSPVGASAVFAENLAGADRTGSLVQRVEGAPPTTVPAVLGVEGASVCSRHGRRREDVGRETAGGSAAPAVRRPPPNRRPASGSPFEPLSRDPGKGRP
ncbi:hypothetical protein ACWD74_26800, partial [Streptomyces fagopyri]